MHSDLIHQLQAIVDSSADSDSNRTIARYLLTHLMTLDALSVQVIASACYASIATVSRFVRSLGYDGFAQLKQITVHYRHSVNASTSDYLEELPYTIGDREAVESYTENIADSLMRFQKDIPIDQLDHICQLIHDSDNVALYGFFQPGLLAKQLQFLFLSIGRYTESYDLVEDHEERARTMKKGDLAIFLSVDGNYVYGHGGAVVRMLRERGATLVLFTQNHDAAIREMFDEVLLLGTQDTKRAGYYKLQLATELLFSRYMKLYSPDAPLKA
ncbi:MAG: MurR/RpiR family transcriptional regulator [Oscillospiraceae bacterium]|nr:MurR/RpiR family transcriptional regulator [Oscillospiraceae bacterium]